MMKTPVIAVLILSIAVQTMGCASGRHVARYPKKQMFGEARFDPDYDYEIRMRGSGTRYQVPGDRIEKREGSVVIRTSEGISEIPSDRIEKIEGRSKKPIGTRALMGMGIGGGSLALLGGLVAGVGSCEDAEDRGDCEGLRNLGLFIGITGGALVGGAIGAGIGALIPKRAKTTITPIVSHGEKDTRAGVGVGMVF